MSAVTVGGASCLELSLRLPVSGRWQARVGLGEASFAPGTQVQIQSYDGALALTGTILRGALDAGRWRGLIVGGRGHLDDPVPPQGYRFPSAQIIAADVCNFVGEVLAPTPALAKVLPAWERLAGPAYAALDALAAALGVPWRTRPDGTVAFEHPTWAVAVDGGATEVARDDGAGTVTYAVDAPRLLPGTTIGGVRAATVIHELGDAGITTTIFAGVDRLRTAVQRLVARGQTGLDYRALYPARVVAQAADGSVDVVSGDPRIPSLSRVPLRMPWPGVSVVLAPGAKVLIGWEGGNPGAPFAATFGGGASVSVVVSAGSVSIGDAAAVPLVSGPALVALLTQIQAAIANPSLPTADAKLAAIGTAIGLALPFIQTIKVKGT